ncbi:hypothetical protein HDC90_002820 [Pedobacter sp. AK013]|uniref:DUF2975 domain-containing protein n=1 Tax=Pedobacter sp. AK013 TaxID=2723071 RepID=UPI00161BDB12|nr:DUF2975 domain-containing protein [Pedobacter sp. AK013]MBB6238191.1 hypothetical protein [Pedobacter sp. AK013]
MNNTTYFGIKVKCWIALAFIILYSLLTIPRFFTAKFVGHMNVKPVPYVYDKANLVKLSDGNTFVKQDVGGLQWKPKNKKEIFLLMLADSERTTTPDLAYFLIFVILAIILFKDVDEAAIFSSKSITKLRTIGFFILIYPFLLIYLKPLLSNLAIESLTEGNYTGIYSIEPNLGFNIWILLIGYFTFMLNKARDLQQENDLTI